MPSSRRSSRPVRVVLAATEPQCSSSDATEFTEWASQTLTVRSREALTICLPFGLKARLRIAPKWHRMVPKWHNVATTRWIP